MNESITTVTWKPWVDRILRKACYRNENCFSIAIVFPLPTNPVSCVDKHLPKKCLKN